MFTRFKYFSGLEYGSKKSKGISLIELMVVIAVLGILSGGTVYVVKNQTTNAYIVDGLSQMDSLESASRMFFATYTCLPGDCSSSALGTLTVTPNSGNSDGIVNNWYSSTATPTAIGYEDVNAIQQLVATGFLTAMQNGNITGLSPLAGQNGATAIPTGYGLPAVATVGGALSGLIASTNYLYTTYNNYYVHGKASNLFYGIKSVHNSIMPSMNGLQNASGIIGGVSKNFVIAAVAAFANPTNMTMDVASYNVMSGMDKKVDGDTPLSGVMQAILVGGMVSTSPIYQFLPVSTAATAAATAVSAAVVNGTTANISPLTGIVYISSTGTAGLIPSSFTVASVSSWSNIIPSSFTTSASSATNVVNAVDLVRPIYGLI